LSMLHSKNMVHVDVKAPNVFIDNQGMYYLGDYGAETSQIGQYACCL